jgi:hypothetical protein
VRLRTRRATSSAGSYGRSTAGAELRWIFCGNNSDPAISCRTGMEARWHRHFDKVRHQAIPAAAPAKQLLAFARRQILEPRNIDLNQSVTETLSLLEKVFSSNIEIKINLASDLSLVRRSQAGGTGVHESVHWRARCRGRRRAPRYRNVRGYLDEKYCTAQPLARPGT